MIAYLRQSTKIYKDIIAGRLFAMLFLLGAAAGTVYLLFSNEADVLSVALLISFAIVFLVVAILSATQYQRSNYLSIFPIKTDVKLRILFFTGERAILVFYSVLILMSLFKADFKMILLEAILMFIGVNMCYLVTDGTDPQKQEFKIVSFILIIIMYGAFGGVISVVINKIVESKSKSMLLLIMLAVLAGLIVITFVNRHFSYKKFKKNILCMNRK